MKVKSRDLFSDKKYCCLIIIMHGYHHVSAAATISTNIKGNIVCSKEQLVLTCTGQGTTQRWRIENEGGVTEKVFTKSDSRGTLSPMDAYQFTLVSTAYYSFESRLSTVVTNAINNTMVECTDSTLPRDRTTIKLAGLQNNLNCMSLIAL